MSKTKKAIFEAAIKVFATSGYNGSTVDEIAMKANVAKGTLYYNFNSKEDIFNFVVENGIKIWSDKLEEIKKSNKEPIDKIKDLCGMQFKLLYDNQSFFKLVISQLWGKETRQNELRNKISEYIFEIERILNEAVLKKQIRECDTSLLAHSLFGSLLSASLYELSVEKEVDVNRIVEELTKNTLRGIIIK